MNETRETLEVSVKLQRWAKLHPEADTQGITDEEWLELAKAALGQDVIQGPHAPDPDNCTFCRARAEDTEINEALAKFLPAYANAKVTSITHGKEETFTV